MIPIFKKVQYAILTCSLLTPISVSQDVGVAECVCSGVSDECHHEPRVVTSVSVSAVDNIFSITDNFDDLIENKLDNLDMWIKKIEKSNKGKFIQPRLYGDINEYIE